MVCNQSACFYYKSRCHVSELPGACGIYGTLEGHDNHISKFGEYIYECLPKTFLPVNNYLRVKKIKFKAKEPISITEKGKEEKSIKGN